MLSPAVHDSYILTSLLLFVCAWDLFTVMTDINITPDRSTICIATLNYSRISYRPQLLTVYIPRIISYKVKFRLSTSIPPLHEVHRHLLIQPPNCTTTQYHQKMFLLPPQKFTTEPDEQDGSSSWLYICRSDDPRVLNGLPSAASSLLTLSYHS